MYLKFNLIYQLYTWNVKFYYKYRMFATNYINKYEAYYWIGDGCTDSSRRESFLTGGIDTDFIDNKEPNKTCWITGNFART